MKSIYFYYKSQSHRGSRRVFLMIQFPLHVFGREAVESLLCPCWRLKAGDRTIIRSISGDVHRDTLGGASLPSSDGFVTYSLQRDIGDPAPEPRSSTNNHRKMLALVNASFLHQLLLSISKYTLHSAFLNCVLLGFPFSPIYYFFFLFSTARHSLCMYF